MKPVGQVAAVGRRAQSVLCWDNIRDKYNSPLSVCEQLSHGLKNITKRLSKKALEEPYNQESRYKYKYKQCCIQIMVLVLGCFGFTLIFQFLGLMMSGFSHGSDLGTCGVISWSSTLRAALKDLTSPGPVGAERALQASISFPHCAQIAFESTLQLLPWKHSQ